MDSVINFISIKSKILLVCVFSLIISSCYKQDLSEKIQNSAFDLSSPSYKTFRQVPGNIFKPSAYFTCGMANQCPQTSNVGKQINLSKINRAKQSKHFNFKGE